MKLNVELHEDWFSYRDNIFPIFLFDTESKWQLNGRRDWPTTLSKERALFEAMHQMTAFPEIVEVELHLDYPCEEILIATVRRDLN